MGVLLPIPTPATLRAMLARFDRGQLADFIETAIATLDQQDGDPDLEDDPP